MQSGSLKQINVFDLKVLELFNISCLCFSFLIANKVLFKKNADQIKDNYEKLYKILDKGGASKITSDLIFKAISK